jgi:hypothetical protein
MEPLTQIKQSGNVKIVGEQIRLVFVNLLMVYLQTQAN